MNSERERWPIKKGKKKYWHPLKKKKLEYVCGSQHAEKSGDLAHTPH